MQRRRTRPIPSTRCENDREWRREDESRRRGPRGWELEGDSTVQRLGG